MEVQNCIKNVNCSYNIKNKKDHAAIVITHDSTQYFLKLPHDTYGENVLSKIVSFFDNIYLVIITPAIIKIKSQSATIPELEFLSEHEAEIDLLKKENKELTALVMKYKPEIICSICRKIQNTVLVKPCVYCGKMACSACIGLCHASYSKGLATIDVNIVTGHKNKFTQAMVGGKFCTEAGSPTIVEVWEDINSLKLMFSMKSEKNITYQIIY